MRTKRGILFCHARPKCVGGCRYTVLERFLFIERLVWDLETILERPYTLEVGGVIVRYRAHLSRIEDFLDLIQGIIVLTLAFQMFYLLLGENLNVAKLAGEGERSRDTQIKIKTCARKY